MMCPPAKNWFGLNLIFEKSVFQKCENFVILGINYSSMTNALAFQNPLLATTADDEGFKF